MGKSLLFALLIGAGASLAGCGGEKHVVQYNETCGKQMTDLQDALDSGAMSRSEYDRARRVAIKHCNTR